MANLNDPKVINALKQITESKKPKSTTKVPVGKPLIRESWQTQQLLDKLNSNKNTLAEINAKPKSYVASNEIFALRKKAEDPAAILKNVLVPLQILDTPRRAVISGVRELADILDSNPDTKASFGDFLHQTRDVNYGFGKAFPIKGWAGRIIGLIGDVALDPMTYATLGGTVAAKSAVTLSAKELGELSAEQLSRIIVKETLADGSVKVATRSLVGKSVLGREGRQKLAAFTESRLKNMVADGAIQMSDNELYQIVKDVASRGKGKLPEFLAKDLGVTGPGVYYFGSRVKVPGTSALGGFSEKIINEVRLTMSNSKLLRPIRVATTPKGVGAIERFGPNKIRDFRLGLAEGSLSVDETKTAMTILEADDARRLNQVKIAERVSEEIAPLMDEASSTTTPMHNLLESTIDPTLAAAASPEDLQKSGRFRQLLDSMQNRLNQRSVEVGGAEIGYQQGYVPHMESESYGRFRLKVGDEVADNLIGKGVDKSGRQSFFKERQLVAGDTWFGHVLKPEDLHIDKLNYLARNAVGEAESLPFDVFETDFNLIMTKYIRSYSDQMSTFGMLEDIAKRNPDLLTRSDQIAKLSPTWAKQHLVDIPAQTLNDMQVALRNHSKSMSIGMASVNDALEQLHGSMAAAVDVMKSGTANAADLEEFRLALDELVKNVDVLEKDYLDKFRQFDELIQNKDGVSNFQIVAKQREDLAKVFDGLRQRSVKINELKPQELAVLYEDLNKYAQRAQMFERSLGNMNDIHSVLPTIGSYKDISPSVLHDVFAQIVDKIPGGNKIVQRVFADGWNPSSPAKYNWAPNLKKAVASMTDVKATEILSRVSARAEVADNELDAVAHYLFAKIVENERLTSSVASRGYSSFYSDFEKGITRNAKTILEDTTPTVGGAYTRYAEWKNALNSLRAGDAHPLQDMLIQEQALTTYLQWDEILRPQGIVIGDDVIDEIIQRKVQPYLVEAIKSGDSARVKELTAVGYGRTTDTGPLGSYRRVVRERIVQGDLFDEILRQGEVSRSMGNTVESSSDFKKQLDSLSPEKRNVYKKYRQRKIRILKDAQASYAPAQREHAILNANYNEVAGQIDGAHGQIFDRIQAIVNQGGSMDTLQTFLSTYKNYKFKNNNIDVINVERFLNAIQIEIAVIRNGDVGPDLRAAIMSKLDKELLHSRNSILAPLDTEIIDSAKNLASIQRTIIEVNDSVNILPDQFFKGPLGKTEVTDVLLKNQGVTRDVVPGVVPTSDEFKYVQSVYDGLKNSDAYPVHKSVENRANAMHILADLNLDEIIFQSKSGGRIDITKELWNAMVNGQNVSDGMSTSGRFGAIMKIIRDNAELYAPQEFATYGDELTDDLLLKKFVEYTLRTQPEVGAQASEVFARRSNIVRLFEKTDSAKFLGKMKGYEAKMLAEPRKATSTLNMLDMITQSLDESTRLNNSILSDIAEWTPESSQELIRSRESLLNAQRQVKVVDSAEQKVVENTVDFVGAPENAQPIVSRELPQIPQSSERIIERGARNRTQIEDLIKQPLEQKSIVQLQEEIKTFQMLKQAGVDSFSRPYTKLIRERQARLTALVPNADEPTASAVRLELAKAKGVSGTARTAQTAQQTAVDAADRLIDPRKAQIPDSWDPLFKVMKPVFDPTPNQAGELVPTSLAATSTEMAPTALVDIGNQLADIARQPVVAAQKELDDTKQLLHSLQSAYDQVASVDSVVDAEAVQRSVDNLSRVSALVQGANIDQTLTSRTVVDYANRTGEVFSRHQEAMKFFEDAKLVLDEMGAKTEWDVIDSVVKAQIDSEAEFWRVASSMSDAEVDRQMVLGVQRMLDGGGTLLPNGKVRLSTGQVIDGVPEEAVVTAGKMIKKIQGSTLQYEQLGKYFPNLYASPEMKAMFDSASRISDPVFVRKMAYYLGPYTKFFKAFAVMSPGFHVRNGIANAMQLIVADADLENMIQGSKLYYKWIVAKKQGMIWEDFLKTIPQELHVVMNVARDGALGGGGGIYTEVFKDAVGANKLIDNWLTRKNYALGQASDNYSRFILAFDSGMKGADAGAAQARVKRFFFDYEDLSTVDKVMKQIIPFWTFYSKNLATQITNMWMNPKPYLIYNSFKRNFEDSSTPLPPFVKDMGGFRLPFGSGLFAMPDLGFTRIPQEVNDILHPINMLNKVTPVLSIPIEQAMGKDAFTGKEFTGTQDRLLNALRGAVPPAQQTDRLLLNDNSMSQLNAWLSYLGSPIRKYN